MSVRIAFLGGSNEIGANSCYIYINGTGILIDSGLHPKKRDSAMFPNYNFIENEPVDLLLLTHAHTDHIGAIPYLIKKFPHIKIFSTEPTAEFVEIMLRDTAKIVLKENPTEFSKEVLSLYNPDIIEKIALLVTGFKYGKEIVFTGMSGNSDIKIIFYPAGHILGSASIYLESGNFNMLHTGDINFSNQKIIPGAKLPNIHLNTIITECTNAASNYLPTFKEEQTRLAAYINDIVNKNGSILIPAFALGKTQEILAVIYNLMRKGRIPHVPIFTAGLSRRISRIYDKYCYSVPMVKPGFEISDIPQLEMFEKHVLINDFFKEPSIVIAQSGMLNEHTISHHLVKKWLVLKNYGVAFVGYQDIDSPGYKILQNKNEKYIEFDDKKIPRKCSIESFRFTSHANRNDILNYITETTSNNIFLIHGEEEAREKMYYLLRDDVNKARVILPDDGFFYGIK